MGRGKCRAYADPQGYKEAAACECHKGYSKADCSEVEAVDQQNMFYLWDKSITFFTVSLLLVFLVSSGIKWLIRGNRLLVGMPDSIWCVLIGMVLGMVLQVTGDEPLVKTVQFPPNFIFLGLLPVIIFDAGFSLQKKLFFRNFGSICLFAIFGTLISAVTVGVLVFHGPVLFGMNQHFSWGEAMAFGALISAVDPVATLATFKALSVEPNFYMLVLGESVMNDAVAIAMFRRFVLLEEGQIESAEGLLWFAATLLIDFFGSIAVGFLTGLGSASAVKLIHIDGKASATLESALVLLLALVPYLLAEALSLSGVIAVLFASFAMAHYTQFNLSPTAKVTVEHAIRAVAYLAETALFLYLGICAMGMHQKFDWYTICLCCVFIMASRGLNIFPLAALSCWLGAEHMGVRQQLAMWFSGQRGTIAFALSLTLTTQGAEVLQTTTLSVVLFTVIVLGAATPTVVGLLLPSSSRVSVSPVIVDYGGGGFKLQNTSDIDDEDLYGSTASLGGDGGDDDDTGLVNESVGRPGGGGGLMGWFADIDERIMQPTFRMRKTRSVGHSYFRIGHDEEATDSSHLKEVDLAKAERGLRDRLAKTTKPQPRPLGAGSMAGSPAGFGSAAAAGGGC